MNCRHRQSELAHIKLFGCKIQSVWSHDGMIILIVACVFGGFTAYVAQEKAYDSMPWLFMGMLFGPLALLAAVGLPDKRAR